MRPLRLFLPCLVIVGTLTSALTAAGPDPELLKKTVDQGIAFLKTTQAEDGSWTVAQNPGITGLVVKGLLDSGLPADDPVVVKGIKNILSFAQPDGGIYAEKSTHRNYETCIAMMALSVANVDGKHTATIKKAEAFLKGLQWDQGEGLEDSDLRFGGAGYGSHSRPDLSNTTFLLEALKTAGVKSDDPAMQKALVFVSRTQNLESEHNTTPFASKINDGGFYYTPAANGSSQAGMTDNGGLRSYASMTYAGLKSMIYAGLTPDDPRVKAATEWLRKNYSVTENPGMGDTGLFYYYHTFARTLNVMNVETFEDAAGVKHDWKKELVEHLAGLQKSNGSWLNQADRWMEGDPNLVTAYVLIALANCK